MAAKCADCGGELEADGGHLVCTKCGACTEETTFQNPSDPQSQGAFCNSSGVIQSDLASSGRIDFRHRASKQYLSKWKTIISNGGDALRLTSEVVKEATLLFERAYNEPTKVIIMKRDGYKRGLCAACLHVACQRNSVNIGVKNIWEVVQANGPAFQKAMNDLKTILNVHIQPLDPFDEVSIKGCLKKYGVEKPDLIKVISQIIKLAKDKQIHTGCIPEPLILAAAFMAWQNSMPNGFKTNIQDFKLQGASAMYRSITQRLAELRKMFQHTLDKIPWVDSSHVKPKEAVNYLNDIIKYQEFQELSNQLSDSDEEEPGENETTLFKPKRPKTSHHKSSETVQPLANSLLWDSIKGRDLSCRELNEEDIPDSEMHHYLYIDKLKPTLADFDC